MREIINTDLLCFIRLKLYFFSDKKGIVYVLSILVHSLVYQSKFQENESKCHLHIILEES